MFSKKEAALEELPIEQRVPRSKFFLWYDDRNIEREYAEWAYVNSGFYNGLVYLAMITKTGLAVALSFRFFAHMNGSGMFTEWGWAPYWITTLISPLVVLLALLPAFRRHRELIVAIAMFFHWPAWMIFALFARPPHPIQVYTSALVCGHFCLLIPRPRFSYGAWSYGVPAVLTVVVGTSIANDYWTKYHKYAEIVLWIGLFLPLLVLHFFERLTRDCYAMIHLSVKHIAKMQRKVDATNGIISHLFPNIVHEGMVAGSAKHIFVQKFPVAAIIVTDVAGFTAWSSRTPLPTIIDQLTEMFKQFDELSDRYAVQRIATVGDCYIGVSVPDSWDAGATLQVIPGYDSVQQVVKRMALFASRFAGFGLQGNLIRLGVTYGEVTGALLGQSPLKYDIFGPAVEECKKMESGGIPGLIHGPSKFIDVLREDGDAELLDVAPREMDGATVKTHTFKRWEHSDESVHYTPPATAKAYDKDKEDDALGKYCVSLLKFSQRNDFKRTATRKKDGVQMLLVSKLNKVNNRGGKKKTRGRSNSVSSRMSVGEDSLASFNETGDGEPSPNGSMVSYTPSAASHVPSTMRTHTLSPGSDFIDPDAASLNGPDANGGTDYRLNRWLLKFYDDGTEQRYKDHLGQSGVPEKVAWFTVLQSFYIYLGASAVLCLDRNRIIFIVLQSLLFAMVSLQLSPQKIVSTRTRINLITVLSMGFVIANFFNTAPANTKEDFYVGDISGLSGVNYVFAAQLNLMLKFTRRTAASLVLPLVYYSLSVMRYFVYPDSIANPFRDVIPVAMPVALSFVSYSIDYSMRDSWVAQQQADEETARVDGDAARTFFGAMDMMMPDFVSKELLGDKAGEEDVKNQPETEVSKSAQYSATGEVGGSYAEGALPEVDPMELSQGSFASTSPTRGANSLVKRIQWHFPYVAVAFIHFAPQGHRDDSTSFISILDDTFCRMENIMNQHGVQKIKTISTTMMCAAGTENRDGGYCDEEKAMETARRMMTACMNISAQLLQPGVDCKAVKKFGIGIHGGSLYGAVVGHHGLSFDVFGDTVNLASRMQSNAPPNTIQLTEQVARYATISGLPVLPLPDVNVKGKGMMKAKKLMFATPPPLQTPASGGTSSSSNNNIPDFADVNTPTPKRTGTRMFSPATQATQPTPSNASMKRPTPMTTMLE